MLNLNSILIGSAEPKELAGFYEKVFQKKPDMDDGGWYGWQVGSSYFSIGEHSEIKGEAKEPQRILLDFETSEVKEEFERISKIDGAKVIKEPYQMQGMGMDIWIATLADPDGNYFQLMSPWED